MRAVPRTWIPREQSPARELVAGNSFNGDGDYRAATPPPLSREPSLSSPTWEGSGSYSQPQTRSANRYEEVRQSQRPAETPRGGPMHMDSRPRHVLEGPVGAERDRFESESHAYRSGGLGSRLGERFDDRFSNDVQPTPSPSSQPRNPIPHRDRKSFSPEIRRQSRPDDRPHSEHLPEERIRGAWGEQTREVPSHAPDLHPGRNRMFDEQRTVLDTPDQESLNIRQSKPIRIRRPPPQDDHRTQFTQNIPVSDYQQRDRTDDLGESLQVSRPPAARRTGSLLDRLGLERGGELLAPDVPSPSLRDRVQIPSKREREEMMNESFPMDVPFDDESGAGDPASKRRRRSGKPRRGGRRGGPP